MDAVLDGWFTEWKVSAEFSRKLSNWLGTKYAILTNSGSSANLLALSVMRERTTKNKVITTATEFPTTISAIIKAGFTPLFIDTYPDTLTHADTILMILSTRHDIAGVVLSHILGFPFDAQSVHDVCKAFGVFFIEDICDAIGESIYGKKVGTFGDISTLSLFPAHHITTGEGGVCFTDNQDLEILLDSYRSWGRDCFCLPGQNNTCGKRFEHEWDSLPKGWDHKYTFTRLGYNLKMTELQAALGLSQLSHLDTFIEKRRANYKYLSNELFPHLSDHIKTSHPRFDPSPFGFPINVLNGKKKELVEFLTAKKIDTRTIFAGNITRHQMMKKVDYEIHGNLYGADYIMNNMFWIGCHPALTANHLNYVIDCFCEFFKGK